MPSLQSTTYRRTLSRRDRSVAAVLTVALVALLILALLRLGVIPLPPQPSETKSFALYPQGERETAAATQQPRRARPQSKPSASPPPPPAVVPPPPVTNPKAPPALAMSHDDFAATDIGHIAAAPSGNDGDSPGADSVAAYGPGEGPGGQRLYRAEWYREPPSNALALYLPGGPQPGWATIACRTVERYHVDNCRELDESPRGSGLSRALRQAAWQFLVRPPRLGGKPLIGAWVSIRFDFTENRPG